MRHRTLLILPALLAACSPEPRTTEAQALDVFERADGQSFYCDFYATDVAEDAPARHVFGTIFDDPQNRARISYGREMLMLFPADAPPRADGTAEEVIYSVENYAPYDARLVMRPTGTEAERTTYEGTIEFRRFRGDTPEIVAQRDFTGSCGV